MCPFQWWGGWRRLKSSFLVSSWDHHLFCVFIECNITWAQSSGCPKALFQQMCPTGAVVLDYVTFHTVGPQYKTCVWPLVPTFCSGKVYENSENCTVLCLANEFAHFFVILWQFAHHSPAHMRAQCWSGDGTRRASAETILICHDLFQLWLRASSQLETQGGLTNVSQSMLQLVSSEKEACSDASFLLRRLF